MEFETVYSVFNRATESFKGELPMHAWPRTAIEKSPGQNAGHQCPLKTFQLAPYLSSRIKRTDEASYRIESYEATGISIVSILSLWA